MLRQTPELTFPVVVPRSKALLDSGKTVRWNIQLGAASAKPTEPKVRSVAIPAMKSLLFMVLFYHGSL